jgi:hypothetical protein
MNLCRSLVVIGKLLTGRPGRVLQQGTPTIAFTLTYLIQREWPSSSRWPAPVRSPDDDPIRSPQKAALAFLLLISHGGQRCSFPHSSL